jgi:hypothetical protein
MKIIQLREAKTFDEIPVYPQEHLVIISTTTSLSFTLKRIGTLAAIIITVFYLLVFYLSAIPNSPENLFASVYSESLIETVYQHILLLVEFDTLIYRKYYDTPLYLWVINDDQNPSSSSTTTSFILLRPGRFFLVALA